MNPIARNPITCCRAGYTDILKWLALIALPAVAWLVGAVGPQWGLPHCGELVTTINAIGLFVGALIGVSQLTFVKADEDGQ